MGLLNPSKGICTGEEQEHENVEYKEIGQAYTNHY